MDASAGTQAAEVGGPLGLLKRLTVDQWAALWREYPVAGNPDVATTWRILGAYALGCVVLVINEYLAGELYTTA